MYTRLSDEQLGAMVREAIQEQVRATGAFVADPERELAPAEAGALRRAGFDLEPRDPGAEDPIARTAAEYSALVATGLTAGEAAGLLGIDDSRVRQRLAERTLYGIKAGNSWRIPRFQFDGGRVLPGIERVVPRLDPELHPVAVYRWFTTPDPDLVVDDEEERALSPRDWLRTGRDASVVAELAAEL